ncbi:MAG TPA: LCP family protein [Acidimicrobiia bacterium]|nr:LCP family protein [Acidimicrobiia bacterium]
MEAPRRLLIAFTALVVVAAACAAEPIAAPSPPPSALEPTTTPTTSSTTTTTIPSIPPMDITGVPSDLARVIESVYEHAAGIGESPVESRYLPQRGVAEGMAGRSGSGGVAHLAGSQIALVATGPDLLAAVDHGDGWQLVAVDLPSLEHRDLGYASVVIAVVGSDARPGEVPTRARADSLHLVGFDGVAGTLDIVGIPRDSWVSIPGGTLGKINSALATGGPERMIAALEALCGYPLDGMLLTGFEGFQEALGNVLGGVQITLDAPMVDSASGANFSAGEQYMNGPQALAFTRTRKTLPLGDIDRQRNGGLVLVAAATTARFRPVAERAQMLATASGWAWSDLSAELVLRLAVTSQVAPVLDIGNVVVPGVPGERGGASVIELSTRAADIFADLADGSLEP